LESSMSLRALVWALEEEQEVYCASEKLTLIALANFSNDSGRSYPEVATICRITRLSDNTVRRCLHNLLEAGVISDTGKRFGPTQQVKVWQLPDACWKREDPRHGGLETSRRPPEDPRKTPGRPPEDPRHGGRTLEPVTFEQGTKGDASRSLPEPNGQRQPERRVRAERGESPPTRRFSDGWIAAFSQKFGEKYRYQKKDGVQAASLMRDVSPEEALETAKRAWSQTDERRFWNCVNSSKDIARFVSCYTKIRIELKQAAGKKKFSDFCP
jgi:hypothetical protein